MLCIPLALNFFISTTELLRSKHRLYSIIIEKNLVGICKFFDKLGRLLKAYNRTSLGSFLSHPLPTLLCCKIYYTVLVQIPTRCIQLNSRFTFFPMIHRIQLPFLLFIILFRFKSNLIIDIKRFKHFVFHYRSVFSINKIF